MTTPPPFEPVAPLPLPDGTWLHESSHSALSRNVLPCGRTTLGITTSRLTMEVMDGALVMHFRAHQSMGNRAPIKRTRRSGTQR